MLKFPRPVGDSMCGWGLDKGLLPSLRSSRVETLWVKMLISGYSSPKNPKKFTPIIATKT